MATFESQNRRMPKIEACLKANGLESLDACNEMLLAKGIDCDTQAAGDIRGISYIYALFYRFELIEVPEKSREKMNQEPSEAIE